MQISQASGDIFMNI